MSRGRKPHHSSESDRRPTGLPRLRSTVADYADYITDDGATKTVFFQYSKYTYFMGAGADGAVFRDTTPPA